MGFLGGCYGREFVVAGVVNLVHLLRSFGYDSARGCAELFRTIDIFLSFVEFAVNLIHRAFHISICHIVRVVFFLRTCVEVVKGFIIKSFPVGPRKMIPELQLQ